MLLEVRAQLPIGDLPRLLVILKERLNLIEAGGNGVPAQRSIGHRSALSLLRLLRLLTVDPRRLPAVVVIIIAFRVRTDRPAVRIHAFEFEFRHLPDVRVFEHPRLEQLA